MMQRLLGPRWIAGHVLALVAVAAFVRLGIWQLDRHAERTELRDAVAAAGALPAAPIGDAAEGSFRRVSAVGVYDADHQTLVLRSADGVSGYHVLTPLRLADEGVLVDRGWIPLDHAIPAPPAGEVEVAGVLWPAEEGSSVPDPLPEVVRRIDPAIQQAALAYRLRSDYLILTGPAGAALPEPSPAPGIGLGPHLGYAGQWFLFASIVIVGYPLLLRRTRRASSGQGGVGRRRRPP